jgi:hypothetical protein
MLLLKRLFAASTLLLVLLVGSASGVSAGSLESHIWTENRTDVWVWVTAYNVFGPGVSKIEGAWCVGPHAFDKHGLHAAIREVRFEVTHHGCSHPVLLDKTVFGPPSNVTKSQHTYYVDNKPGGGYVINGAPDRAS